MNSVLLDSDALIALSKVDDSNHKGALAIKKSLSSSKYTFYISNLVLSEVITVLSQRVGHKEAIAFVNTIERTKSRANIVWVDKKIHTKAIEIFRKQTSKNISFVDCANIAICQTYEISQIFSFDKHYTKNNIELATP